MTMPFVRGTAYALHTPRGTVYEHRILAVYAWTFKWRSEWVHALLTDEDFD